MNPPANAKCILGSNELESAVASMAQSLAKLHQTQAPLAVVAIRRGGEALAKRLSKALAEHLGEPPQSGAVDISLYRDDGFGPNDWPEIGATDIEFALSDYTVVLVDDVLYTGRTVRAAIDAILDYGRPKAIRLAVLVDRGLRELPIYGDVVGHRLETTPEDHVEVVMAEQSTDNDGVYLRRKTEC